MFGQNRVLLNEEVSFEGAKIGRFTAQLSNFFSGVRSWVVFELSIELKA